MPKNRRLACFLDRIEAWIKKIAQCYLSMAAIRAIEYLEAQNGPGVDYDRVYVVGADHGQTIVSAGGCIGKSEWCVYFAVDDQSDVVTELPSEQFSKRPDRERGLIQDCYAVAREGAHGGEERQNVETRWGDANDAGHGRWFQVPARQTHR